MHETQFDVATTDGWPTKGVVWEGDDTSRGVVQIAHGAAEHGSRYRRVAETLTAAGYVAVANDHRGHGESVGTAGLGVAGPGGWEAILEDLHQIARHIRSSWPERPLVLFGHSMGAMLAQQYLGRWGDEVDAAVISGSSAPSAEAAGLVPVLDAVVDSEGADGPSALFAATFAGFNEPFAHDGASGYEWLSRDADEVADYVADPWCGHDLSNGFVRDMIASSAEFAVSGAISQTPNDLPILVVSGDSDPVGGHSGDQVEALADMYRSSGCTNVTLRLYENGRHEMLNEINRDEVTADLVAWLDANVGTD